MGYGLAALPSFPRGPVLLPWSPVYQETPRTYIPSSVHISLYIQPWGQMGG